MSNPYWGDDWPGVRDGWSLARGVAHLNHGSFGAVPIVVQHAQLLLRAEVEANPNHFYGRALMERLRHARTAAATFVGADVEGLAVVPNTTAGLSLALASVPLRPATEVIVTDHAYPAAVHAAEQICRRSGARLRQVELGLPLPDESPAETEARWHATLLAAVNEHTAACLLERIASSTGVCLPVGQWVNDLRVAGVPTIVDAAHVPGTLAEGPIGDFWVASLHKWPCAPRGVGLLAVHPDWRATVQPLAPSSEPPSSFPANLSWWGTADYSAVLCAPDALTFLRGLGWAKLRSHNRQLVRVGATTVAVALGTGVGLADELFETMALVPLPAGVATTRDGARALSARIAAELRAEVAVVAWGGHGWLRLSAHAYNHPAEYEALALGLVGLLG